MHSKEYVCLRQVGKIELTQDAERVLGLHLLQFAEVRLHPKLKYNFFVKFIGSSNRPCVMLVAILLFTFSLPFRLLKRLAQISCQMFCVNTYTAYPRILLDSIPPVRYLIKLFRSPTYYKICYRFRSFFGQLLLPSNWLIELGKMLL